jgi:micrococcal nuclease
MHLFYHLTSFLLAAVLLVLPACNTSNGNGSQTELPDGDWVTVYKVVDGDTFWGRSAEGNEIKVRLTGIDAPESRKSGQKEVQYFGKEASAYVRQLISGKQVKLVYDVRKTDRYNRTLAYVYLEDGTFLNAHLVEQGYAILMTIPPNVRHANLFVRLQEEARESGRGLWGVPIK